MAAQWVFDWVGAHVTAAWSCVDFTLICMPQCLLYCNLQLVVENSGLQSHQPMLAVNAATCL